jgi:DNA polymerase III delta prime subunit
MNKNILEKISKNTLLINKHSPKNLEELILPEITRNKLNHIIKSKKLNHSIFVGKTGTGKTLTSLLLAKELISKEDCENNFLFLNASDDRGLDMIKQIIEPFCSKKISEGKIKLVIIDEGKSITTKAQPIIANLMEINTNTKFILTVNDLNEISNSIQSRSSILYFPALKKEDIVRKLEEIVKKEKINLSKEILEIITDLTERDLRQSINFIEALSGKKNKMTKEEIYEIFIQPNPSMVKKILKKEKTLELSLKNLEDLVNKGFSSNDILLSILNYLTYQNDNEILEKDKIKIYEIVSKYYIRVNQGTETKWQLYGCMIELYNL